jgi:hypothetical protein
MSTNCDKCGYRDNEVKSGSAISDRGKRITLKVEDREDLSRDILKVIYIFPANAQNVYRRYKSRARLPASLFPRSSSFFSQALWVGDLRL